MSRTALHPTEIRLNRERTELTVRWDDGAVTTYAAAHLRNNARDATSVRHEVDGWAVPAGRDLTITSVEAVGAYAVRLSFSDGHDRGIFPWSYLGEIADARRPGSTR
jgi:DUF971 family protein